MEKKETNLKQLRHLHLVGATGTIRTATYDNREHLVVPVVAMVEGVVWAVNSDVPEFVPAEELAQTPHQWNGRGCFAGHPEDGGTQITANTPRTLEKSFGLVFDASNSDRILETRRLELSAWLDPAKAEALGPDAMSVVRRLRAGETVEVSVGCYVESLDEDGEWKGKQYHGRWTSIVSDHLAFLAVGEKGACSVAAGCGAGRRATRHLITAEGIRREEEMPVPKKPHASMDPGAEPKSKGFKERIASFLSSLRDNEVGVSDRDLRYKIDAAIRAIEPGYMGLTELYPDGTEDMATPHAIYDVCPADEWMIMRRGYTLSADGAIALDATAQHIEPVTTYEVVTAASAAKPPCGCGIAKEINMELKDRIAALIANPFNKTKDPKVLESIASLNEDAFSLFEAQCVALKAASEKEAADKVIADKKVADDAAAATLATAAGKPVPMTREQMLAAMPDVQALLTERASREAAEKDALVESLKSCGVKTDTQLKAATLDELRTMAAFAKVAIPEVDYSFQGVPRTSSKSESYAPPDAYAADLAKRREATKH